MGNVGSESKFKTSTVDSFEEFLEEVKTADTHINSNAKINNEKIDLIIFRGQDVNKNLFPKIGREKYKDFSPIVTLETNLITEFKRLYLPFVQNQNLTEWDILSLAQHHSLPTRLLDWTENPLIALWFAFYQEPSIETERVVWCLGVNSSSLLDPKDENIFSHLKTKVFKPKHVTQRIINQSGWFTSHYYENDIYSALNNLEAHQKYLYRIVFKKPYKENSEMEGRREILKKLNLYGINWYSVFPDLEGLCRHLDWKTSFLKEKVL